MKLLLTSLLLVPLIIQAETLFYCKTVKGKQAKIERKGSAIYYTYGKNLNQPELALSRQVGEVDIGFKGFPGSSYAHVVAFDNGDFGYELHVGKHYEDNTPKGVKYGMIMVYKNGNELATIDCDANTIPESVAALER